MSASKKLLYAKRKKLCVDKLGGVCVICGSVDKLEFDHIDRSNVGFRIGGHLWRSIDVLFEELKKCQLLCREHHVEKTLKELGRKPAIHGTASRYSNRGCRCIMCTRAWAEYIKPRISKYRKKNVIR